MESASPTGRPFTLSDNQSLSYFAFYVGDLAQCSTSGNSLRLHFSATAAECPTSKYELVATLTKRELRILSESPDGWGGRAR